MSLAQEIKQIPSGVKELREFGVTLAAAFSLLAAWLAWNGSGASTRGTFIALSLLFVSSGLVLPTALRPIQKVWMTLALLLGWVMTRVLLAFLFFAVLTPIAFFLRAAGKRFLDLGFDKNADSYWKKHEPRAIDSYENQF